MVYCLGVRFGEDMLPVEKDNIGIGYYGSFEYLSIRCGISCRSTMTSTQHLKQA